MAKKKQTPENPEIFSGRLKVGLKRIRRYKNALNKLREKLGRAYSARDIVKEAKSPKSPLHDYFTWDVQKAAHKHWLNEARDLVQTVRVYVTDYKGRRVPGRALTSVRDEFDEASHVYVETDEAQTKIGYRKQMIQDGIRELDNWFQRFRILGELKTVLEPVEKNLLVLKSKFFGKKKKKVGVKHA